VGRCPRIGLLVRNDKASVKRANVPKDLAQFRVLPLNEALDIM
jgi:hypothetical protein